MIRTKSDLVAIDRQFRPRRECTQREWVNRAWRKHCDRAQPLVMPMNRDQVKRRRARR